MPSLTRRVFAASALAASSAAALPSPVFARVTQPYVAPPPIARRRVGRFEVTFLSDGYIDFPYAVFTGAPPEAVQTAAARVFAARPQGIRGGFTVWLVRDGDQLILIDAGPAGTVSPTSGRLPAALAALGVRPDQIDALILTHLHVDHIAGAVAGGRAVFNNADVYADRRDIAHFTDPAKAAGAPDLLKSSFAKAQDLVRLYPKLHRLDGEREIARGISTIDLTGHTPGQIGVRIADGDESLLIVSDMLFHPAAHPALPGLGILFEADKAAADAARARFFPRAAEEKALLAATHMPFPGLGRIVKDGGALAWLPADWDYEA